jgi:hypothetical protein
MEQLQDDLTIGGKGSPERSNDMFEPRLGIWMQRPKQSSRSAHDELCMGSLPWDLHQKMRAMPSRCYGYKG